MAQAQYRPDGPAECSLDDYIALRERQGIFDPSAAAPECDPRVHREFLSACRSCYPDDPEPVVDLYQGYGFFRDTIDWERMGKGWALSTPVIDGSIGIGEQQFLSDLPALARAIENAGDRIVTDTFSFSDGYGSAALQQGVVRLNSPVAEFGRRFSDYIESLTSDRRKKYRRLVSDFETAPLAFSVSDAPLSDRELKTIHGYLQDKWGNESGYAFRQTLWAAAAQKVRPSQSLVMRVTDADRLVFIQTMIVKSDTVFCQSIAKDEESFYSGLAAYTDFKCIEALCGHAGLRIFDPSCRTSLEDPESIGVAKRATVNRNRIKPLLALGDGLDHALFTTVQGKAC